MKRKTKNRVGEKIVQLDSDDAALHVLLVLRNNAAKWHGLEEVGGKVDGTQWEGRTKP